MSNLINTPQKCTFCGAKVFRGRMLEIHKYFGPSGEYVCEGCVSAVRGGSEVIVWVNDLMQRNQSTPQKDGNYVNK